MFIGRTLELEILNRKISSNQFEFGIIYGRRRIGKTRLLQEVVKKHKAIYYVANEMGIEYNLHHFGEAVAGYFGESISFDSFEQIFQYLVKRNKTEKVIVMIDEFTYLIASNPDIMSVLQNVIDQTLIHSTVKLILSGSHVGMVEDALSYKKPLYGRSTFKLKLKPFDYYETSLFYPNASNEDKIRFYSVFGGVPYYASKIDDRRSVKENIIQLMVEAGSIFEEEVDFFLSQEVRRVATYGLVLNAIASGATKLNEITTKSGSTNSGTVSKYLDVLRKMEIVEKEICFGEKENSRKTIYKIKDPLFHFYYVFIEKNKSRKTILEAKKFYELLIEPKLDMYVSFVFEKVCTEFLIRKYAQSLHEIGRYWYNDAIQKKDIEIDIVLRRDEQPLVVYECKWTSSKMDASMVKALKEKGFHLDASTFGGFSKLGYTEDALADLDETFHIDDLYSL